MRSLLVAFASSNALRTSWLLSLWNRDLWISRTKNASGYIRSPPNNNPITDVTSSSMTCNVNNAATAKTIEVKGGDKITFEWHHNNRDASDDIIAESHKGPVLTYIAPTKSNGAGEVWVKLAEDGFANGKWAVDTLIANKGKHSITLPDLAAGEYLLRPEIIALHEGNRQGGAQLYMECVQIKVTSSGAKTLPAGVAIPGAYTATDKGILFDIYNTFSSYPIPGPKVWDGASGGAAPVPVSSAAPVASQAPAATTFITRVVSTTVVAAPGASAPSTGGAAVAKWGQCGGKGFTGSSACVSGSTCKFQNDYYSQCL
ncbi:glycosyl hydrolase family 61-domain-containing protein [Clohesyomyces aquaticus]|uniref:AA9 family lytic polysaccharide monooxygenase n=1 Tax=Clohesyomyces aquaticus TaxID=1231657 RepID=A0A1Y1ZPX5_9PLEO|nr:glycosyl hydrolase family 61-domain-containing protein [Clohesyomyces aquaticus]